MTEKEALQELIGEECSDNLSPTLRSRLVAVNKNTCTLQIVPNKDYPQYNQSERAMQLISRTKLEPIWLVSNMFFGQ